MPPVECADQRALMGYSCSQVQLSAIYCAVPQPLLLTSRVPQFQTRVVGPGMAQIFPDSFWGGKVQNGSRFWHWYQHHVGTAQELKILWLNFSIFYGFVLK